MGRNWSRTLGRWVEVQQLDALKEIARSTRQPQGKYQRLPDGTWGYPPQPPPPDVQAAFQDGWRQGWEAGYKAAMEQAKTPA